MNPILVTGGAKGFGAAICKELAARGHDIMVHFRKSEKEAASIVAACKELGVNATKIYGDFSTPDGVNAFLQQIADIKGLVNNVGNYLIASPSKTEENDWHALFQTNFFTPISLIQGILPALKKEKGAIVNIGVSGLNRALINATAYATTKSALLFYTRSLAKELASDLVTVNMVSPGFLETAVDLDQAPKLPMKRPATLQEGAEAVAFFFEPRNHYITGQNIEVAGGFGL